MRLVIGVSAVVVLLCFASQSKNLRNSAVGCWKGTLNPGGEAVLDKRLFGKDGSGRVDSDNFADKLEPTVERDAVTEDLRTC